MTSDPHGRVPEHSLVCADLAQTRALAARIAALLRPGDAVLLDGPLAAGKTTFVAMMCEALGVRDQVSSPTYTISNIYAGRACDIYHVDAYRLSGPEDFFDLGIDEFLPDAIALIEWGERVAGVVADPLEIRIALSELGAEARAFHISAAGRWAGALGDPGQGEA